MPSAVMVCPAWASSSASVRGPSSGHRVELQAVGGVGEDRVAEGLEVLVAVAVHAASLGRAAHGAALMQLEAAPSKSTALSAATSATTASGRGGREGGSRGRPPR